MRIRLNRKHVINVNQIDYIKETSKDVRVYLKAGYPRILITNCTRNALFLRMVNAGVPAKRIKELKGET